MKLIELVINHGGKINADETGPFVITWDSHKKVGLIGDEGAGKTKVLEMADVAMGHLGGEALLESLRNKDSGKLDIDLKFVGKDRAIYEVRVTNSQFIVKRDGESQKSPKELLRDMLGVVGVSPMSIKNASIDEIVKWLASYSVRGAEEFEKQMLKLKKGIKEAKSTRAAANGSAKGIREYLVSEGYMEGGQIIEKKWTASEKSFSKKPNLQSLSNELDEAGKASDKVIAMESRLKNGKAMEADIQAQIQALQEKLAEVQKGIKTCEKFMEDNKDAKKKYDEVKKRYDNAAKDLSDYNKWQDVKGKKTELDQFETIAQRADATEKDLLKKQQELQWEVIPDIKGVEIVLEDSHEDEGELKKAGFYFNNMTSRQMSASEWIGIVIQILKKNKVPVLLLDDTATLGSKVMETIDGLVKSGCYVLYTEMKRGQTEIEIQYK